ncbi:hypothetical protein Q31a_00160 [Aureliella helgolandensis]|uniref:Uncharacterized protein n=1 Tax=Aureliella helgolandensis TaxID=2527968 RepID=A0A518FZE6_9BACT|nr:hypothetical protein Q31a_00160 [Aureliella helgolandensis]
MRVRLYWADDSGQATWHESLCCSLKGCQRAGSSLIEVTIATLLVSISLVASLNSMAMVVQSVHHGSDAQQAAMLAQLFLSEISSLPFEDTVNAEATLGRETGESSTRSTWDDCDDYQGWTSSDLTMLDGQPISNASGWSATVTVNYCNEANPSLSSGTPTLLKRIALQLDSPGGTPFAFETLRYANGTLSASEATASTLLSSVDFELKSDAGAWFGSTRIHNQQELTP